MRVIHGDAVEHRAAREDGVPHLLEPGHAAASGVVDLRVAVVDLEQAVVAHLLQLLARDRPAEVGVVDVRDAAGRPDGIHRVLQHVDDRRACLGATSAADIEPVDVQRRLLERRGYFLAPDHEELPVGAVQRVERIGRGQEVVVGEHEEGVAVLAIPAHDVVGRGVAVAVERVRVRVALVPARRRRRRRLGRRRCGHQRGERHDDRERHGQGRTSHHGLPEKDSADRVNARQGRDARASMVPRRDDSRVSCRHGARVGE